MRRRRGRAGLFFTVSLGAALVARTGAADDWPPPTPRYRLLATSILGGSYNPEGIEEQARLGAQMRLYRSDNPALRDNFVFVGTNPRVNPTAGRAGASIEIQPLTVFNLRFNLEFVGYFRSFGAVQSFSSPLADFSSSARERGHERGADYATTGARLSVSPFFQIKVGPIAVRDQLVFEYFAIDLRAGDSAFYEPAFDTLIPGRGKVITNDLDLFYVHDLPAGGFFGRGRIAAGARYTMFEPLFDATDFPAGDDPSKAKNGVHRVGPLVAMTLFDDGFTRFQKPTVVAFAQWYAAHRNRTGRDMPQAVPYVVLAFIFQSDLLAGSPDP